MALLKQPPSRQRGDSLLEVLVAVLVIGVGAMGVAKLQMLSTQNTREALQHGMATALAEDMLERLRANPTAAYAGVGFGAAPPAFVDCLGGNCTSFELAMFDVVAWKCALGRWRDQRPCDAAQSAGLLPPTQRQPALPGGDGAIAIGADGVATVTVTWQPAGRVELSGRR